MVRKCFEVLDGSGKVELVARAREAPQPHAFKAMVSLQVRKTHLYFLALIARLFKSQECPLMTGHDRALLR